MGLVLPSPESISARLEQPPGCRYTFRIMFAYVRKNFRFSPKTTVICVMLAAVMLWCSRWQWERYLEKSALVATYAEHSESPPLELPEGSATEDFGAVLDRKVELSGTYDYSRQVIVTNRKDVIGPGHLLLTPLKLDGSKRYIIVSRGFIPFADRAAETWEKYTFAEHEKLQGVVKASVDNKLFSPSNPEVGPEKPFARIWYYPEISKMAEQLPYPVIHGVYIQRIGPPPAGKFPLEYLRIEVPPQTHFGYTIEWAVMAAVTLLIGFLLQIWPRRGRAGIRFELPEDSERPTIH